VDSRAAVDEGGRTSGSGPSSSSLSSYSGSEGHRHLQQGKQRTTTVDFSFVFLFCSADLHLSSQLSFFSFPLCYLFQTAGSVDVLRSTAVQLLVSGSVEMEENEVV
jgi:hypothetical protein